MATGKVKWFNNAKGYGFILRDGSEEDLFAHFSSIQMDGYRTLKAGQAVEFEVADGPKGLCAINITALDDGEDHEDDVTPQAADTISVSMQNIDVQVDVDGNQSQDADITVADLPEIINEAS